MSAFFGLFTIGFLLRLQLGGDGTCNSFAEFLGDIQDPPFKEMIKLGTSKSQETWSRPL
jgi:hypothetical protein